MLGSRLEHSAACAVCRTLTSFSKLPLAMLLIFERSCAGAFQAVMITLSQVHALSTRMFIEHCSTFVQFCTPCELHAARMPQRRGGTVE